MVRKQEPAASILADLPERSPNPGHIQALRRNGRSFTLADQVNRLVGASEADPDRGLPWGERWRSAPCRAPTLATGIGMSGATVPIP